MISALLIPVFVAIFGLIFGSFVTCASYRLPRGEQIVHGASYCPSCKKPLAVRDLVPVFSWLVTRGACRQCKTSIHWRYPLIEVVTALLFLAVYAVHGISMLSAVLMLFSMMLLIMIVADFEHYIIPDEVHLVLLPLGVVYHVLRGSDWMEPVIGTVFGAGLALSLMYGYRILRKREGLGFGDVKFFAVAGLWLPLMAWPPYLFLSGIFGILTAIVWRGLGKGAVFPFGPSLALALWLGVVVPEVYGSFWQIIAIPYN